jgi:glycosyltransferase involved in cell wall biosynthesis
MIMIKSHACISDARVRKILLAMKGSGKKVLYSGAYKCSHPKKFKYEGIDYSLIFRKRSIFNLVKTAFLDFQTLLKMNYKDSLYFIDEAIPITLLPVLFFLKFRRVKLYIDLFDSHYLKSNRNRIVKILLRITYLPFTSVIVTDENRAKVMGELNIEKKIVVVENYPYFSRMPHRRNPDVAPITLFFYGSLSQTRGWPFIKQFQNHSEFKVYLAGWDFLKIQKEKLPSNFEYLGLLSQSEIMEFMRTQIDWVFCMYAPINQNNINASPNKIFDAMHAGCGVIINSEVGVSEFVRSEGLGVVVENYDATIEAYIIELSKKNFQIISSKDKLLTYSFNKYVDFYKGM